MLYVRRAHAVKELQYAESHYSRFLDKEFYLNPEWDCGELLHLFNIPDFLNNDTYTQSNGYFGCRGTYDNDEKLESYSTLSLKTFL
jgi:hypothetical protein